MTSVYLALVSEPLRTVSVHCKNRIGHGKAFFRRVGAVFSDVIVFVGVRDFILGCVFYLDRRPFTRFRLGS